MPAPDDLPVWATSGSAEILDPPDAKKALGHVSGEPASAGLFNAWWNLVYRWIDYLNERSEGFSTLEAMIAELEPGESGLLNEDDIAELPGSNPTDIGVTTAPVDIACDGVYLYRATATIVTRYTRSGKPVSTSPS